MRSNNIIMSSIVTANVVVLVLIVIIVIIIVIIIELSRLLGIGASIGFFGPQTKG